ncbi:MAG: transposase [Acidobacteria bacterium]|nr:transposase [Acidobacteriota bacterium]
MPRLARVVVPGIPHHVTQRGNRRQQTFFYESDFELYKQHMAEWCSRHGVKVLTYCLMPNHTHLVLVPSTADGLARAVGEAHRHYTSAIHERYSWRGYFWQGRFGSFPMDEEYLLRATRYILLNPVRAGFVSSPFDWPHSSARAHRNRQPDPLIDPRPLDERVESWDDYLATGVPAKEEASFRKHQRTGRPLGSQPFVRQLEKRLGRRLRPRRPGRPPKRQPPG